MLGKSFGGWSRAQLFSLLMSEARVSSNEICLWSVVWEKKSIYNFLVKDKHLVLNLVQKLSIFASPIYVEPNHKNNKRRVCTFCKVFPSMQSGKQDKSWINAVLPEVKMESEFSEPETLDNPLGRRVKRAADPGWGRRGRLAKLYCCFLESHCSGPFHLF